MVKVGVGLGYRRMDELGNIENERIWQIPFSENIHSFRRGGGFLLLVRRDCGVFDDFP